MPTKKRPTSTVAKRKPAAAKTTATKTPATKTTARKRAPNPKPAAAPVENTGRHPLNLPRTKAEVRAIERLRRICMALPDVYEKIAWGEPTWRAPKIFAQLETHHHGVERVAVWLPARSGVQEALVEEDPEHYFRPPYVGVKGWVGVRIDNDPDWRAVAGLVAEACREVAPARLIAKLDATAPKADDRGWRASWLDDDEPEP